MKERICQMKADFAGHPTTSISLELPVELYESITKTAELEETDANTVINCFIQQGLSESKSVIKRLEFADHAKEVLEKQGVHQSTIDEIFNKLLF